MTDFSVEVSMSVETVRPQAQPRSRLSPGAAEVVRIITGAVAGIVPGMVLGAVVYQSLVTGLVGAVAGAGFGMIRAVRQSEGIEG